MFEIIFLGTSASAPSIHRGLPAQVIKHAEYRFLVDCGEGTQRQILQSGIGFKNLTNVLITHGHLDHILGLGGLISTLARWETIPAIDIYGSESALERIDDLIYGVVLRGVRPAIMINLRPIKSGVFFSDDDFHVLAFPVTHRGSESFGYAFQQNDRRPFLPEKAAELDIPPGPWRRDLAEGREARLPDGRIIDPEWVLGEVKPGMRVALVGDTAETDSLLPLVQGVDALVMEATYMDAEVDMARKYSHITARESALLAKNANAGQLILTHISRRYREKDILKEARAVFPATTIARDFDTITVKRQED